MFNTAQLIVALAVISPAATQIVQSPFESTGVSDIPPLGFGTWNLDSSNASDVVSHALQTGYRHIDCAVAYGNQVAVGLGIKEGAEKAGLKRSDFWVTSKLWNDQYVLLMVYAQ